MAVKTCFACRESGHTAKECPTAVGEGRSTVGICYKYATLGFSHSAIQIAYHHPFIMVLRHTKDAVRGNTHFLVAKSQKTDSTPFHLRNALCVHKRVIFLDLVRTTPRACTLTEEAVNYAAKTIISRRTVLHGSQVHMLFLSIIVRKTSSMLMRLSIIDNMKHPLRLHSSELCLRVTKMRVRTKTISMLSRDAPSQ
jgi:hypothetical protein